MASGYNYDNRKGRDGAEGFGMRTAVERRSIPDTERRKGGRDFGHKVERGLERMAREEREAHPGQTQRSAYWTIIGPNPDAGPDDRITARERVWAIEKAIGHGGWTKGENRRLHDMRRKWTARAEGKDPQYLMKGNRAAVMNKAEKGLAAFKIAMARPVKPAIRRRDVE